MGEIKQYINRIDNHRIENRSRNLFIQTKRELSCKLKENSDNEAMQEIKTLKEQIEENELR
eukprot:Pgem_evm1s8257